MAKRILYDIEDEIGDINLSRLGYVVAYYRVHVLRVIRGHGVERPTRIYRVSIHSGMKTRVLDWLNPISCRKVPHD